MVLCYYFDLSASCSSTFTATLRNCQLRKLGSILNSVATSDKELNNTREQDCSQIWTLAVLMTKDNNSWMNSMNETDNYHDLSVSNL